MTSNATTTDPRRTESETDHSPTAETEDAQIPDGARPLAAYLDRRLSEEGTFYDKSRFIAREIEFSAKEIGSYMSRLQETAPHLQIEKWGYTNGTTWRISRP